MARAHACTHARTLAHVHVHAQGEAPSSIRHCVQIAEQSSFLETSYCLLYGELPTSAQLGAWTAGVLAHSRTPAPVINALEALPAESHPMSILMAGIAALGAVHPEQNPALAGQGVYKSRAVQDAAIVTLLGQVPTIAAFAYHRCARLHLHCTSR